MSTDFERKSVGERDPNIVDETVETKKTNEDNSLAPTTNETNSNNDIPPPTPPVQGNRVNAPVPPASAPPAYALPVPAPPAPAPTLAPVAPTSYIARTPVFETASVRNPETLATLYDPMLHKAAKSPSSPSQIHSPAPAQTTMPTPSPAHFPAPALTPAPNGANAAGLTTFELFVTNPDEARKARVTFNPSSVKNYAQMTPASAAYHANFVSHYSVIRYISNYIANNLSFARLIYITDTSKASDQPLHIKNDLSKCDGP